MKRLLTLLMGLIGFSGFAHAEMISGTIGSLSGTGGSTNLAAIVSFGNSTGTSLVSGGYVTINDSGTSQALNVTINGTPSGGSQNEIGGVTINGPSVNDPTGNTSPALLVIRDSSTNNTNGAGEVEIWQDAPGHNSYLLWIHGASTRNSDEPIRFDGPTYGIDEVSSSTDSAHGLGKWKVISIAYQTSAGQIVSPRAWDNSTFENLLYATPFTQPWNQPAGIWLNAQTLTNDGAVLTSSDTSVYGWQTQNNHTVGLTAPLNPTASFQFALPATFNNQAQVLYQSDNGRGNNNNARSWSFTTGGVTGYPLLFQSAAAPIWSNVFVTSMVFTDSGHQYVATISTAATGPFSVAVSSTNHLTFGVYAASPTISACGTGPSLSGGASDTSGIITTGSTGTQGCTLTFKQPFTNTPVCVASSNNTSDVIEIFGVNNSSVTFGISAALTSGKIYYHCFGDND